jgi:hypothetical protein
MIRGLTGHEILGVGVEINEDLDTIAVGELLEEIDVDNSLGSVAGRFPPICIVARIRRRTISQPFIWPVAVQVAAPALAGFMLLAILAPHSVLELRVDKT